MDLRTDKTDSRAFFKNKSLPGIISSFFREARDRVSEVREESIRIETKEALVRSGELFEDSIRASEQINKTLENLLKSLNGRSEDDGISVPGRRRLRPRTRPVIRPRNAARARIAQAVRRTIESGRRAGNAGVIAARRAAEAIRIRRQRLARFAAQRADRLNAFRIRSAQRVREVYNRYARVARRDRVRPTRVRVTLPDAARVRPTTAAPRTGATERPVSRQQRRAEERRRIKNDRSAASSANRRERIERLQASKNPPRPSASVADAVRESIPRASREAIRQRITIRLRTRVARIAALAIPGVGIAIGVFDIVSRIAEGNFAGVGISAVAAAGGFVPLVGGAISISADAVNLARDVYHDVYGEYPGVDAESIERFQVILREVGAALHDAAQEASERARREHTDRSSTMGDAPANDQERIVQESQVGRENATREDLSTLSREQLIAAIESAERLSNTGPLATRPMFRNNLARLRAELERRGPAPTDSEIVEKRAETPIADTDSRMRRLTFRVKRISFDGNKISGLGSSSSSNDHPPVSSPAPAQSITGQRTEGSSPSGNSPSSTPTTAPTSASGGAGPVAGRISSSPMAGSTLGGSGTSSVGGGDFQAELQAVAGRLGVSADDLMAVIRLESGGNPTAVNPSTEATGLIQFIPRTASALGTTVQDIRRMSAVQQLGLVERYFRMVNLPRGASAGRIYAAVFLPGRANQDVLTRRGEPYYEQNSGLDTNRDGMITIDDLNARLARYTNGGNRQQRPGNSPLAASSDAAVRSHVTATTPSNSTIQVPVSRAPATGQTINKTTDYVPEVTLLDRIRRLRG